MATSPVVLLTVLVMACVRRCRSRRSPRRSGSRTLPGANFGWLTVSLDSCCLLTQVFKRF
jgi:hypothetical protein